MITTQILTKNNFNTIEKTLKSIISLNSNIVVIDMGSIDETIKICKSYGAEIICSKGKNYSEIRNSATKEGINFYIEPWEELITGHDKILNLKKNSRLQVADGKFITKQIRVWTQDYKFVNPIYEIINDKSAKLEDILILSSGSRDYDSKELKKWMENRPTDSEPYYYEAFNKLINKDYKEYCLLAEKFLFMKDSDEISQIMTKYYLSNVYLYLNEIQKSLKLIIECIGAVPTMAEFWCLLGDIHYKNKLYKKALSFYQNAIIIGTKRAKNDLFPIDLNKYKDYPDKMIQSCNKILSSSTILKAT